MYNKIINIFIKIPFSLQSEAIQNIIQKTKIVFYYLEVVKKKN